VPDGAERTGLAIEEVVQALRRGCPFNRRQTAQDLVNALQSELDELRHAVEAGLVAETLDELGDVLFNLMSLAALHEEQGDFTAADVDAQIAEKMMRRHPYVFGDEPIPNADEARTAWATAKHQEKIRRSDRRVGVSVLGLATEVAPGRIAPDSLDRIAAAIADVLDGDRARSDEACVVRRTSAPGCAVVVCGLPDRRAVSMMAFTETPLEPEHFRALIEPVFDGATVQVCVREVPGEH
jgi:NTP pyrophosphatase (non-canonical NTP hydrolase)